VPSLTWLVATALLQVAAPEARPPAPPGLSWAQADALARKLGALQATRASGGRVEVSETELNSFLGLSLAPRLPEGVSHVSVRFGEERLEASATVDVSQIGGRTARELADSPVAALLGNALPVFVSGRLRSDDGFGTFEVEQVLLGSIPVPVSVVAELVARSTRSDAQPGGFDIRAPFRYPQGLRRVVLKPGSAWLEF
jgi:hypothetical protein